MQETLRREISPDNYFLAFSLHENKPAVCKMSASLPDMSQTYLADTRVKESIEACIPQRRHLDEARYLTVNKECISL